MSSEDAMDDRVGGGPPPPASATTAGGQVEDAVAEQAPRAFASAGRSVRVLVSPVAGRPVPPPTEVHSEDDKLKKMRAMWFNDMRGWLMVVAVQVASVTYQAGLDPPSGLAEENKQAAGQNAGAPVPESKFPDRYYMFFYFNTTAFVTSLAIIILLMTQSFYHSEAKVVALEIIVVLDMVGLMGAYWAGTTRKDQTAKYVHTLGLIALVLFVVYVVYSVELLPKLWRLVAAAVPRRAPAARVRAGDAAAGGGALPAPGQIDEARASSQRQQDEKIARSTSAARRRGSRPAGAEPSRMLSP